MEIEEMIKKPPVQASGFFVIYCRSTETNHSYAGPAGKRKLYVGKDPGWPSSTRPERERRSDPNVSIPRTVWSGFLPVEVGFYL